VKHDRFNRARSVPSNVRHPPLFTDLTRPPRAMLGLPVLHVDTIASPSFKH
jgi:hypothetical protein